MAKAKYVTVTRTKFLNALEKGWKLFKYARGAYYETRRGREIRLDDVLRRSKVPCGACAAGAIGYVLGVHPADISNLCDTHIIRLSDEAHSKRVAIREIREAVHAKWPPRMTFTIKKRA